MVMPTELAERLAAQALRRGRSVSDLVAVAARQGLARDG
ncbi:MAG: ribbon-helix-helix protein, CopG family, partial [Caulobacterales bacterium]